MLIRQTISLNIRLRRSIHICIVICLSLLCIMFRNVAYAQEPIVTNPDPLQDNPSNSEVEAREQMSADIASRVPSDFQIVYFASPDSSLGDALLSVLGVTPVTDWQSFTLDEENRPIQIAIIDKSALPFVDSEWTREAYKSRVILVGLDLSYDEMVSLTGDQCSGKRNGLQFAHHFWIFHYTYSVELDGEKQASIDESLKQLIDESALESCLGDESSDDNRLVERPESVSVNQGFYFSPITDTTSMDGLASLLMYLTYQYGMPNPRFQPITQIENP